MKQLTLILFSLIALSLLQGCANISERITRTETDVYTITKRDTTIRQDVKNTPGDRDNGTIYPSPRTIEIERSYRQTDSIVNRYYPAFLRFGGIETAGFFSLGNSGTISGNGLFGLYKFLTLKTTDSSKIFGSFMYRLMPYEIPLRAFKIAETWSSDWTLGTAAFEQFTIHREGFDTNLINVRDTITNRNRIDTSITNLSESLTGVLPIYVRKRFFLRDTPPYVMVIPFLGLGILPNQYVNLGVTLDVGSYGGFNLRAYGGYVAGGPFINNLTEETKGVNFPYFGIGVSALDFVNKNSELYTEWKDHKHSAIEVSGLNYDMVYATNQRPDSLDPSIATGAAFPSGELIRFASATYPLPFYNGHFFVGTSLLNVVRPGPLEVAFGFLPIRAGYRVNLMQNDLNFEPFAQYTYFPSTIFEAGIRTSLKIHDWAQIEVLAGYISADPKLDVITGFDELQGSGKFATYFVGIGLGIGDFFRTVEEVQR